jgi:hypothetical protein
VLWTVDPTTALPNSAPSLTHPDCREPFAAQWSDVTWGQLELPQFMGLLIHAQLGS